MLPIAIFNLLSFVLIGQVIGGDALNGKVEKGKYYLGGKGVYKEVKHRVFIYSKWHTRLVFVTHLLALISVMVDFSVKADHKMSSGSLIKE